MTQIFGARPRVWVAEGDSITQGTGATSPYPSLFLANASPPLYLNNYARAGSELDGARPGQRWDTVSGVLGGPLAVGGPVTTAVPILAGGKYIYSILMGTNDVPAYASGGAGSRSAWLSLYAAFLDSVRTYGFYVILCTIPSCTGKDAEIQAVNTTLRTWSGTHCDVVCDFGANTHIGATNACNDTTYFNGDAIHLNDTGHALMETIIRPLINAV